MHKNSRLTLLLTDNDELLTRFVALLEKKGIALSSFDFAFSPVNQMLAKKYVGQSWIRPLRVKDSVEDIVRKYDLVLSLHSKQLFPAKLVNGVRCVNIHPGLNPHNRGWFPQVFSILNKLPCGATIHVMDEELDHGPIIAQMPVEVDETDTSLTIYKRVLDAEMILLDEWLEKIIANDYEAVPAKEGNVNLKKDFDALCQLDMGSTASLREHIDLLRALTHGEYGNAFFVDKNGEKVFVKIELYKKHGV